MTLATVEVPTSTERMQSEALLLRVDELLDAARQKSEALHRNYVEIGVALLAVAKAKAWMLTESKTYDQYVQSCEARFGRGRTALYGYASVARELLPYIPEATLVEIGISKSQSLAAYVKRTKRKPDAGLLEAASNPEIGIEQFKTSVAMLLHDAPQEKGKWRSLEGFYASDEEWAEIERGFEIASRTDPAISADIPDWARKKEIMQRLVMEFLAEHEERVLRGEG